MPNVLNKQHTLGDNAIIWIGAIATIAACIMLDKPQEPHKWHAAIVWTCLTFVGVILFGRTRWRSWLFWTLSSLFLFLHVILMWWIFDKLLPGGHVWGTLYVMPLGFVEGIVLVGLIARLEQRFAKLKHHRPRPRT